MSIYINSALAFLALLPLKMCTATDTVVLGPRATVLLENCSCDGNECKLPEPAIFIVNCSTIQTGLTLMGCEDNTGGSSVKCLAVSGNSNGRTLVGCNFPTNQLSRAQGQCGSLPRSLTLNNNEGINNGGRKIKLTSNGNCNFFCGSISGQNQTIEQQEQSGQRENGSNSSTSPREVESALKASPGGGSAASTTNGDSSHSTPRGPESSEHDGTSEKLSASNSTAASTKSDAQNEGAELGAMKVVVRCAAASLFISSAFF
ncbi:hypothetical protein ERJ75_001707700 [Trypanosoma vivax]|nr:hypothetical protein ERJ75_001707700 [Trypanosoma vivax]